MSEPKKEKKQSLIQEIVISLLVLMVASTILISFTLLWVTSMERLKESFTPFILLAYILLFALVVGIFGTMLISRVIVRPLRHLLHATEKLSRGEFGINVVVEGNNELSQLALAFNQMSEKIKEDQLRLKSQLEELERVNKELKETQDQLIFSEKLATMGRLSAGIAHEIGNPLSAISGYVEILGKKKELNEKERDIINRIQAELKRINHIIRELLDYSRAPSGEFEGVDLNQVVNQTVEFLKIQKKIPKINYKLELDEEIPKVEGRKQPLQQLLINLILNSMDALPEGGDIIISTARIAQNELGVELKVRDTGIGIPKENLKRIFDPFFTTKEPGKGVGLGLSICLKIVQSLNGEIDVESEPGKGTTFSIKLRAREGEKYERG